MNAQKIYEDFLAGRCTINFSSKEESDECIGYLSNHIDLEWVEGGDLTKRPHSLHDGFYVRGVRVDLGVNRLNYIDRGRYNPQAFGTNYAASYSDIKDLFVDDLSWNETGFLSLMGGVV